MIIYVLDDGETYTLSEPTPVPITPDQLTRIEAGEKVYNVIPDWDEHYILGDPQRRPSACNCMNCTTKRWNTYQLIKAQQIAMEE